MNHSRYGDIYHLNIVGRDIVTVCDLDTMQEMFSMDAFSGRGNGAVSGPVFDTMRANVEYTPGLTGSEGTYWDIHGLLIHLT